MEYLVILSLLAILVYCINVVPALMPPTWIVLAFYYIHLHTPLMPTVVVGAVFATLGRITLYFISKRHFRKIFSQKILKNYDSLGRFLDKKRRLSIPLFLTYAFFPISSNYVYITAGLTRMKISILAASFFIGRLFSYFFWVTATHIVYMKIEDVFSNHISNLGILLFELSGFAIVILIGNIKWEKKLKI